MGSRKGRGRCFNRFKLSDLILPDRKIQLWSDDDDDEGLKTIATPTVSPRNSSDQFGNMRSAKGSPYNMSPFSQSPWVQPTSASVSLSPLPDYPATGLVGSLVREEGHVYSLATSGDLLYTGSESKNIRVWKNWREFTGFKSGSGFVKAIVVAGEKIFTGHQDGKIRVWKMSTKNPSVYKRIGTLPRLKDFLSSSFKSSNYVEARRHRNSVWIQHFDAVSCLSLDEENGVLYSGSWDRTVKVWRIADSRCLESINAHEDAVNSVAAGLGGMVFTGSADGTVKAWRKGAEGHELAGVWLRQESAVTSVVVVGDAVYCGSSDGAVNCWERGVYGGVLTGHRMAVLCLAAGGGVLASGSADGSICVWARREGGDHTKVAVLTGHSGPVKCVAVEEDPEAGGAAEGRWVVFSGSLDLSVKIWRVSEAAPSHVAEKSSWVGGEEDQSPMGSTLGQVAEILMEEKESMAECDHHPHPTTNE